MNMAHLVTHAHILENGNEIQNTGHSSNYFGAFFTLTLKHSETKTKQYEMCFESNKQQKRAEKHIK